jgi:polyisoprenoid-binding protein YceI
MKFKRTLFSTQMFMALLVFAAVSIRSETIRYEAKPGSKVKIDGTSTVHDWTVESAIIGGYMEFDSNFPLDPAQANADLKVTPKVQVSIPVRSIKSGKSLMDEVMHDAMKVKDFDKIQYSLTEMKLKDPNRKPGDPLEFDTKGELTVSGVKKPIDMVVAMRPMGDKLKVTGSKALKMTDFGIKPPSPTLLGGLIKTSEDVKITFEWMTARKDEKKTASAQ